MMTNVETQPSTVSAKVTLPTLTAMVVGSMIGAGSSPCRHGSDPRLELPVRSSPGLLLASAC